LIIRDMMLRGKHTYKQLLDCDEKIATNILADRMRRLMSYGIIIATPDPSDGRKLNYSLTEKGIELAPVMAEMVLWAAAHEKTGNQPLVRILQKNKETFLKAIRERWATSESSRKNGR
jgi:DNA-binding HxlR family transcriptional regulator